MKSNYGGKAQSLISLRDAGFAVPEFSLLSVAESNAFRNESAVPQIVFDRIFQDWENWGSPSVAVRSSATCEDGQNDSFAGIFESYLGLKTKNEIIDAIINCCESVQSERVRSYCEKRNVDFNSIGMGVVIQRMIEPDFAGVIFSMDPLRGSDNSLLIESCTGRGEKLVSGLVTPSRYRLTARGQFELDRSEECDEGRLSAQSLMELRELASRVQRHYGKPQDIEFAIQYEKIYLLQSRDITHVHFKSANAWTTADFRDGGVSAGVVSPMMWELYDRAFSKSMPEFLVELGLLSQAQADSTHWYDVFYARPYWNLSAVKKVQAVLPGFVERNFDRDMSIPIHYEGSGLTTGITLRGITTGVRAWIQVQRAFKKQEAIAQQKLTAFSEIAQRVRREILADSKEVLLKERLGELLDLHLEIECAYFTTIYNASNAKLEFSGSLATARKTDPSIEYIQLIANLGILQVTQSAVILRQIAEMWRSEDAVLLEVRELLAKPGAIAIADLPEALQKDFADYITLYGHHSERELDLRVPRWHEDLRFCLRTFLSLTEENTRHSAQDLDTNRSRVYQTAVRKFEAALSSTFLGSWRSKSGMKKLERVRRFLWLREEMREISTRVYGWIRELMLIIEASDPVTFQNIFYLYSQEVLGALEGRLSREETRKISSERMGYVESYSRFKNPNEIGLTKGSASIAAPTNSTHLFQGIGCSSGLIRARARVVKSIEEVSLLQQDEILIAPFTDPGWTPVLGLASAVVTETGGLLSHAALISREYGIPSVLGVPGVTDLIKSGQMIEVDGERGIVRIIQ